MPVVRHGVTSLVLFTSLFPGCAASNVGVDESAEVATPSMRPPSAESDEPTEDERRLGRGHVTQVARMMRFADAAYRGKTPEAMREVWERLGMTFVASVRDRGPFMYDVVTDATSIVVVFRGTDDIEQWFTNFDYGSVEPSGEYSTEFWAAGVNARYHGGFFRSLEAGAPPLLAIVRDERAKHDLPLYVTGHSLGGAYAQLFGWLLTRNTRMPEGVYAFASPKVGNGTVVEALDNELEDRLFRFYDGDDPVPVQPTSWVAPTYARSPREVNLLDPGLTFTSAGTFSPTGLTGSDLPTDFGAHLPEVYLARLEALEAAFTARNAPR
ncbi:MAG: lipase family protein [Polyangiaceae bacterium]